MFHVDNSTGVPVMPQPSPVTSETELFFTEGGNGVPPTYPGPDWFNVIQSELLNILKAAGIDPDKMDNTQILVALKKLFLSRSNPFGDIKADGAAAIAAALTNLGLGEGSALPVGVPVPWPSATPPTGWLKCNGAAFSAEDYPNLAKAYPTLKLPDLRGEFIRGWDGGKGVDSGRTLLSAQGDAIRNITGVVGYSSIGDSQGLLGYVSGAFSASESKAPALSGASASGYQRSLYANFNASAVVPTANENRPRNIAFNYIVRAA
ncbi:integrase [Escherichia coli]|nr:phage tail protein [Escherichia coli]OZP11739.1 integrase [Escherichia coli]